MICLPGEDDGRVNLSELVTELGRRQIDSLLVEGGGEVHDAFRSRGLVDHICCYIAPKIFGGRMAKTPVEGEGVSEVNEALMLKNRKITMLGDDILLEYDC